MNKEQNTGIDKNKMALFAGVVFLAWMFSPHLGLILFFTFIYYFNKKAGPQSTTPEFLRKRGFYNIERQYMKSIKNLIFFIAYKDGAKYLFASNSSVYTGKIDLSSITLEKINVISISLKCDYTIIIDYLNTFSDKTVTDAKTYNITVWKTVIEPNKFSSNVKKPAVKTTPSGFLIPDNTKVNSNVYNSSNYSKSYNYNTVYSSNDSRYKSPFKDTVPKAKKHNEDPIKRPGFVNIPEVPNFIKNSNEPAIVENPGFFQRHKKKKQRL